ncbi:MerR family transcriptional regulator [Paenibacillus lemnae]|uniref:MerR family transcriptional regulator n=1 Tax=Paenibacillus lemnae TaxID=1330551 RepID=A0A848M8R7_PAELE|nr:MerR family transcriptional regulator [Paenibacillus lemnae]NMO96580.1 MerR family transcriptional regulator [Paenibacillus lemnae]
MKKSEVYLTAGEFAKLYEIKKDTLFFYDKIGLFCPQIVEDNGYRYYHVDQCRIFNLIELLKASGMELKDIKKYLDSLNPHYFLDISKVQLDMLNKQKLEIEYMIKQLENTIQAAEFAIKTAYNIPRIEYCDAERYAAFPLNVSREQRKQWVTAAIKLFVHCMKDRLQSDFLRGGMIRNQDLYDDHFEKSYILTKINGQVTHEELHIRPAGLCAVMEYKGSYEGLGQAYAELKRYILDNGYTISGNAYELELLGYYMVKDRDSFVIQITIPVKKE